MATLKSSDELSNNGFITQRDTMSYDADLANSLSDFLEQFKEALSQFGEIQSKSGEAQLEAFKTIWGMDDEHRKKSQKEELDAKLSAIDEASKAERDKKDAAYKAESAKYGKDQKKEQAELKKKWKQEDKRLELLAKNEKNRLKEKYKEEDERLKKQINEQREAANAATANAILNKKITPDTIKNLKKNFQNGIGETNLNTVLAGITSIMSNIAKGLETTADQISSKQSAMDTRLQGSRKGTKKTLLGGDSYWLGITSELKSAFAISPLVKQEAVVNKVESMVNRGIAFNVEQRAALDVMKDKIAGTFEATNSTLLRLVRIQQQDTTAGRLGMESALTAFLNNMYETTEYMSDLATQVKSSLEESMSLMSGENALSFEYQVQKWMGSMYSVGMNSNSVQGIAGVIGQIAAGQLEGITNGTTGNLALMAANRAGLSVSEMMTNGLDDSETNALMQSMVNYLSEIYDETKGNNVLQQQYAKIYGLNASDLRAISNLASSSNAIGKSSLSYNDAMNRLNSMANSMYQRTAIGELMSNAWDNALYSMATGLADNPVLYGLMKTADLLDSFAGGIDFNSPLAMGSGTTQTFNVANIMRTGALLGSIGGIVSGIASSGSAGGLTGSGILNGLGINKGISVVSRGSGVGAATVSGATVSESGSTASNGSMSDVASSTMASQTDENNSSTANAVNSSDETKLADVDSKVQALIDLFEKVLDGNQTSLNVRVTNTEEITTPIVIAAMTPGL